MERHDIQHLSAGTLEEEKYSEYITRSQFYKTKRAKYVFRVPFQYHFEHCLTIANFYVTIQHITMGRADYFEGSESTSLFRMRELRVKIGMDRNEKYTRNRGLVNQHRTGTIS
jgi:hypothetical protein